jgi:hypothetical protein
VGERLAAIAERVAIWLVAAVVGFFGLAIWGGIALIFVLGALDIFGVIDLETDESQRASAPIERSAGPTCDPNYTGCVPDTFYDVDCDEVAGPVQVVGYDTNGLDADGDGVACEWG